MNFVSRGVRRARGSLEDASGLVGVELPAGFEGKGVDRFSSGIAAEDPAST